MNKAVKRILTASVAAVLALSCFTGCQTDETATSGDSATGGADKVYQVGICQFVQHPALDEATKGFKDALVEEFGNDGVKFDEQNAAGDSATCATITNGFAASNVDLIFANATAALQAATAATSTIPIVGTSITDYATALGMSDWTGVTGINATGTSDLAPLDEQAAMIKELFPDVKQVGILYCSAEPNSQYQASVIEKALDESSIAYKEFTTADTNDIVSVVTAACNECDVLYIPTDNTLASAAETVNSVAEPAGIPIVAGEEGICKGCGIATLSISYYSIGYEAGKMAADILVNGKDPAEMEIKYAQELTKKYVPERASALNVTIPSDYEAIVEE